MLGAASTNSSSLSRERGFADPKTLMAIRNLELRARVVVEGFWKGLHRSPYHGFSVEFTEYRQYSPGDDTRYLDWRLYARSDRHYLKRFEDETNLRCHLLVDQIPNRTTSALSPPHWPGFCTARATPWAWSVSTNACAITCPRVIVTAICAN